MKRKTRHTLITTLLIIALIFAALDAALWHIDPAGVVRYLSDYAALQSYATPAPHGLTYAPGTYQFRAYTVTIDDSGFRAVPASGSGACTIAFIGDSLTFGLSSDMSFVDVLAPEFDATFVNRGIPGYNIDNLLRLVETARADGYVYLSFFNDAYPPLVYEPPGEPLPALILYRDMYLSPPAWQPVDTVFYRERAAGLIGRSDVLTFAFEGVPLSETAIDMGAVSIPMYTHVVSRYDGHPNAAGHQQIVEAMRPYLQAFVEQRCR